jgi:hypothetical protein
VIPYLRRKEPFHVLTSLSLKKEVQPFWQRTKTVIVGWFVSRIFKHYNKLYTWQPTLLCSGHPAVKHITVIMFSDKSNNNNNNNNNNNSFVNEEKCWFLLHVFFSNELKEFICACCMVPPNLILTTLLTSTIVVLMVMVNNSAVYTTQRGVQGENCNR